jgi:hypothetical protein
MAMKTIKLYRILDDGRRLSAGSIRSGSPTDLPVRGQLFLATAERGLYVATYRGCQLGLALAASRPVTADLAPLEG